MSVENPEISCGYCEYMGRSGCTHLEVNKPDFWDSPQEWCFKKCEMEARK